MKATIVGWGLFKGDELVSVAQSVRNAWDLKEAKKIQSQMPILTEEQEGNGYRWAALFEVIP